METDRHPQRGYVGWALGAVVLMAVIAVACGGPAATSAPTAQNTPQPTSTVAIADPTPTADTGAATIPTPAPQPAETPQELTSARDSITLVTSNEPASLDIHHNFCSGNIDHMACKELTVDPLTWIDGDSFEVVPLSPVESWEQM
jgi:hypothetical protein